MCAFFILPLPRPACHLLSLSWGVVKLNSNRESFRQLPRFQGSQLLNKCLLCGSFNPQCPVWLPLRGSFENIPCCETKVTIYAWIFKITVAFPLEVAGPFGLDSYQSYHDIFCEWHTGIYFLQYVKCHHRQMMYWSHDVCTYRKFRLPFFPVLPFIYSCLYP